MNRPNELQYVANYNGVPINLNIWESEMYYAAIPVQQMIGNLIYYSNFGRYELRLAKSWKRISDNLWKIRLHAGFKCENGEEITSESFVGSLKRSLYIMSKHGDSPVLNSLLGYDNFLAENENKSIFDLSDLFGLRFDGDEIIFEFDKPVRDGLLQILSFAPYGYICSDNLNSNGTWKDSRKIISSGPYKLKEYINENQITLEKNAHWVGAYADASPDIVHFSQGIDKIISNTDMPLIVDSFSSIDSIKSNLNKYDVVQEYFKGIALGNFQKGIFSHLDNRKKFKSKFLEFKRSIMNNYPEIKFSDGIYPSQEINFIKKDFQFINNNKVRIISNEPVLILGSEPKEGSRNWLPWLVLKKTLDYFLISYTFSNTTYSRDDVTDNEYDIRIVSPAVGRFIEPWIVEVLFFSKLNACLPDPSGGIHKAFCKYNNNVINNEELAMSLFQAIEDDSAIIPFNHFGIQLYISKHIDLKTISTTVSIIKFDQLTIFTVN